MICHLIESRADLSLPIEVWVVRQTVVLTGLDEGFCKRMRITLIRHAQGTVYSVILAGVTLVAFRTLEVGQHFSVAQPGQPMAAHPS